MIKGVSFEVSQTCKTMLFKIFDFKETGRYYWHIVDSQTEAWDASLENDFFSNDIYVGHDFKKHIQNDHLVVFAKIQAYHTATDIRNISTYDEFLKSNCHVIFLLYDCKYVEIYSKSQQFSNILFQHATTEGFSNVNYITDGNDKRTKMDIF